MENRVQQHHSTMRVIYDRPSRPNTAVSGIEIIDHYQNSLLEYWDYLGEKNALIRAGVVPQAVFSTIGKSGIKNFAIRMPDGRIQKCRISKRAKERWRVLIYSNYGEPPHHPIPEMSPFSGRPKSEAASGHASEAKHGAHKTVDPSRNALILRDGCQIIDFLAYPRRFKRGK